MSIQDLKRIDMTTEMNDFISMVYFNNIYEYYPVKTIHLLKVDIGLLDVNIDVDILQALNMYGEDGSKVFVESLYAGTDEEIKAVIHRHMDALKSLVSVVNNRLKVHVLIANDCDETTAYVINKIIHSGSKNITIVEVFEME